MPPQERHDEFRINDKMPSRNSESSLIKEDLNCSIDSVSTASTCISRGSESDFEIESPPNFRYRQSLTFEQKDEANEPWPVEKFPEKEQRYQGKGKRQSSRSWLYYTFGFILTVFVYTTITSTPMSIEEAAQYSSWRFFLRKEAPALTRQIRKDRPGNSFTILLKGTRLDFVQQSIDAHSDCTSVEAIHVDFDGSDAVPDTIFARSTKVSPVRPTSTTAVLLLSDDVILTCNELETGFQNWKKDPSRLVGYFGFQQKAGDTTNLRAGFPVVDFESVVAGAGSYSLVSDRAVFAHKRYISSIPLYNHHSTCCELLLSMQVSAVSGKAPALIKADPLELSSSSNLDVDEVDAGKSHCLEECFPRWLKVNLSDGVSTMM
eukprot:scaffold2149_cov187-Cylindrotheca_fusiformis.AAC.20